MPPQAAPYRPDPAILALGPDYYDEVRAAEFPETILRFRNDLRAGAVGLAALDDDAWLRHFARFEPLPGNLAQPLALRYHGHQFRSYNPNLGDGRGFLFAQLRDAGGRLLDLGTKGSGTTPWSRSGDGRLTLKGGVREILATEMLAALGVDTSHSLSLVETGEALQRGDEPSPTRSAVLVRLQHSHIRIGTFQRLAYLRDDDGLRRLAAYCQRHYDGDAAGDEEAPVRLLATVAARAARLAASYIAAGFVHGVLNTDNIAITCQSFDYGPWRFTPKWDGHFTAAYFDHAGLYSFGRQPEAIHWNLVQLASALSLVAPREPLQAIVDTFRDAFQAALAAALLDRLGVASAGAKADAALVGAMERALAAQTVGIDRFFFDWRGGALRHADAEARYAGPAFDEYRALAAGRDAVAAALDHPYWQDEAPSSMHIDEVEAIWAAIERADDWAPLHAKVAAVRRLGEAHRRS